MSTHIVIDGYNYICQTRRIPVVGLSDLRSGRDALIELLARYKKIKPFRITIVFDGRTAPADLPRRDRSKGIDIHYSRPGETADTVIMRMAAREREKLLVVTSDNAIARDVQGNGAVAVGIAEFEERLMLAQYAGEDNSHETTGWQPTTRKKGPSRRLPKSRRKKVRKLSKI